MNLYPFKITDNIDSKEIKTMFHSILCRFLSAFLKIYWQISMCDFFLLPQTWQLKTTHLPNETNFVWKKLSHCATIPNQYICLPIYTFWWYIWHMTQLECVLISYSSGIRRYFLLRKGKRVKKVWRYQRGNPSIKSKVRGCQI